MQQLLPRRPYFPHPLALCCHCPVSKCRCGSIAVTGTVRVKSHLFSWMYCMEFLVATASAVGATTMLVCNEHETYTVESTVTLSTSRIRVTQNFQSQRHTQSYPSFIHFCLIYHVLGLKQRSQAYYMSMTIRNIKIQHRSYNEYIIEL